MGHLHYKRHFLALAVAAVALFLLILWDPFSAPLLPIFAVGGALHAAALIFALRAPQDGWRKCYFVALAAALSVATLYIGILGLQLFALLSANERLYLVLAVCAAAGAIIYGSLIRLFWLRDLSSRSLLAISMACVLAVALAFFTRRYFPSLEGWWLIVLWWCAFSGGLWYADTYSAPRPVRN